MRKLVRMWPCFILMMVLLAACMEKPAPIKPYKTVIENTNNENQTDIVSSDRESDLEENPLINEFSMAFNEEYLTLTDWDKDTDVIGILGEPLKETIEVWDNADTLSGSVVKTLYYEGLTLKLFSPKENKQSFWISSMIIINKTFKTFRGITIGHTVSELKQAYKEAIQALDGRTDPDNCAYTFNKQEKYIWFEVANGLITEIKYYMELG